MRAALCALADLLAHGTVAPIAQSGAYAPVALGSRADQFQDLLGFDVQSSSKSRVFDASVRVRPSIHPGT